MISVIFRAVKYVQNSVYMIRILAIYMVIMKEEVRKQREGQESEDGEVHIQEKGIEIQEPILEAPNFVHIM